MLYQRVEVRVLAARTSDHKPITVRFGAIEEARVSFQKKFKVEAAWMKDEEYNQTVSKAWE